MNVTSPMHRKFFRPLIQTAFSIPSFLMASTMIASSADSGDPAEYVVFLGLDVSVSVNGAKCPVVSGGESSIRIWSEGRAVSLSLRDVHLATDAEPKLSRARATIEGLSGDRVHSLGRDPVQDALAQQMVMETAQSHAQEIRQIQANAAAQTAIGVERAAATPFSPVTQSDVENANRAASVAASDLNAAYVAPAFRSSLPGKFEEDATFDGFEVSFRVSTAEEHQDAYGVLRLLIRAPLNLANKLQVVKFFNVRNLGPKPRKLLVRQMGLPAGFVVDSYTVHLYADGREIPTNASPNRFDIGADEAHQFLILRHLQANRQATIPAQVIPELRSTELSRMGGGAELAGSFHLQVDAKGRITKVSAAAVGSGPLSTEMEAALLKVRLLPALVNGQPAASEGTFTVAELSS